MARQASATVLAWAISFSAVLSLRMIYSGVWWIRFMEEPQAEFGRLRTLIQLGPVSGGHIRVAWVLA